MSDLDLAKKEASAQQHPVAEHIDNTSSDGMPVGRPKTTKRMMFLGVYVGMAGWMYNFDLGYSGIVLQMMPFKEAFGTFGPVKKANGTVVHEYSLTPLQQSLVSVAIIFIGLGGALAGPIGKYGGRRGAIRVACSLIAVGAGGMLGTAGSYLNYMVCKCIQGIGLGILLAASPLWGAEVLLAEKRGLFLSLFGWGLAVGQTMAGCVCLATSKYTTYLAWQTPIICHIPLALIFGSFTFVFPESPRWLLTKGRESEARKSFAIYYGKAIDDPVISYQVQQTSSHIEAELAAMKTASALELLRGVNLRRTFAALIVVLGIALTGIRFITTYAVIFLAGVGVGSPYLVTVIMASCVCVGVIGTPALMEYLGRRFGLLAGYSTLGIFMLLIAAVGTGLGQQSRVAQLVLVVFLCLWNFVYGLCLSASLATISAEQHSVRLRTNGQAFTIVVYEVFAFGLSFAVPYMISPNYGNMGLNIGYFFAGISLLIWLGCFFFVPETGRLTLEQIDDMYASGKPAWRTSLKENKRIAATSAGI